MQSQQPAKNLNSGQSFSWLLVSPTILILAFFLVLPLLTIAIVSFWDYNEWNFFPAFIFDNYVYLL